MYTLGLAKTEIDIPLLPVAMMGYGDWHNRVKEKETNLYCRAFMVQNAHKKLIFVNAEMLMITPKLRKAVLTDLASQYPQLNIASQDVMLTAQHTHSAPSGYGDYAFYNFTTPGFCVPVFNAYKNAIVKAITLAHENLFKGTLNLKKEDFRLSKKLAWNRFIKVFNNNPDITPITPQTTSLGVDREMKLLEIKDENKKLKGSINWFGVHTTSIRPKNTIYSRTIS